MKILIVRADGIGDALVCAPLVTALRAAGHAVGAVFGPSNRAIFARDAFVAIHVLERIPWPAHGSTQASYRTALQCARAERYDLALVASEEPEAYAFARDAAITRRVGFVNGWGKPLKSLAMRATLTRAIVRPAAARDTREHEVRTIFRLAEGVTLEREPTRDLRRLRELVLGRDGDVTVGSEIVIQASAKFAAYGLDGAAFVALAKGLRTRGEDVAICGDDAAFVRAVAAPSGSRDAGGLDVTQWKLRIGRARALVTPDCGAAHVGGMLGVPTVDAFAPGPATAYDARRWSPWAAPYRIVTLDPSRAADGIGAQLVCALDDLLARERAA